MHRPLPTLFVALLTVTSALAAGCLAPDGEAPFSSAEDDGKTDCQGPLCEGSADACATCGAVFEQCWVWVPDGDDGALCVDEHEACRAEASLSAELCPAPDLSARRECDRCRALFLDCAARPGAATDECDGDLSACLEAAALAPSSCAGPTDAQVGRCLSCRAERDSCAELDYVCDGWFYGCAQALGLGRTCLADEAE